jgi:hypothetical protein
MASSRRSFPQNISAPTKNIGAPKMPRAWASAVRARSAALHASLRRRDERAAVGAESVEDAGDDRFVADLAVVGEVGQHDLLAECRQPWRAFALQRNAGGEQRIAREVADGRCQRRPYLSHWRCMSRQT